MFIEFAFAMALAVPHGSIATDIPADISGLVPVDYILPAQRVVIYPPETDLRMLSDQPLSSEAQTAFDSEFATAAYYGAFAVSKDGGWGYSTGSNSIEAARDIAVQQCLTVNARCAVIAEILPVGYVDIGPGDVTVSPEVAGQYNDASTNLGFYAMAISADGAYSKYWNMPSQAEADSQAAADCENYRISDLPNLGAYPCLVLPRPKK